MSNLKEEYLMMPEGDESSTEQEEQPQEVAKDIIGPRPGDRD